MAWLDTQPQDDSIRLQRDGLYPFLGYADLTQPPAPLLTFRDIAWLLILVVGLPVLFWA
jgi:hypothetical protein